MRTVDADMLMDNFKLLRRTRAATATAEQMSMMTRHMIRDAETVEAVPLLPLCKLLAEINGKPCYTQPGQEACDATLGDFKCCGMNDEAGCWERLLRAWMDTGMEDYT